MIKAACPFCGIKYELADDMKDKHVECECGNTWVVGEKRQKAASHQMKAAAKDDDRWLERINKANELQRGKYRPAESKPEILAIKKAERVQITPRSKGERKLTEKQLEFLIDLGVENTAELREMGRRQASLLISELTEKRRLAMKNKNSGCLSLVFIAAGLIASLLYVK